MEKVSLAIVREKMSARIEQKRSTDALIMRL